MIGEEILLARGIIRICRDCEFKTTERKEMRLHERRMLHIQDRSMQDEVKRYSPEEQAGRKKYGRKAVKAMGV
jgi:hypothetical protein